MYAYTILTQVIYNGKHDKYYYSLLLLWVIENVLETYVTAHYEIVAGEDFICKIWTTVGIQNIDSSNSEVLCNILPVKLCNILPDKLCNILPDTYEL